MHYNKSGNWLCANFWVTKIYTVWWCGRYSLVLFAGRRLFRVRSRFPPSAVVSCWCVRVCVARGEKSIFPKEEEIENSIFNFFFFLVLMLAASSTNVTIYAVSLFSGRAAPHIKSYSSWCPEEEPIVASTWIHSLVCGGELSAVYTDWWTETRRRRACWKRECEGERGCKTSARVTYSGSV